MNDGAGARIPLTRLEIVKARKMGIFIG